MQLTPCSPEARWTARRQCPSRARWNSDACPVSPQVPGRRGAPHEARPGPPVLGGRAEAGARSGRGAVRGAEGARRCPRCCRALSAVLKALSVVLKDGVQRPGGASRPPPPRGATRGWAVGREQRTGRRSAPSGGCSQGGISGCLPAYRGQQHPSPSGFRAGENASAKRRFLGNAPARGAPFPPSRAWHAASPPPLEPAGPRRLSDRASQLRAAGRVGGCLRRSQPPARCRTHARSLALALSPPGSARRLSLSLSLSHTRARFLSLSLYPEVH